MMPKADNRYTLPLAYHQNRRKHFAIFFASKQEFLAKTQDIAVCVLCSVWVSAIIKIP
jgi:hypothetical protein